MIRVYVVTGDWNQERTEAAQSLCRKIDDAWAKNATKHVSPCVNFPAVNGAKLESRDYLAAEQDKVWGRRPPDIVGSLLTLATFLRRFLARTRGPSGTTCPTSYPIREPGQSRSTTLRPTRQQSRRAELIRDRAAASV